MTATRTAFLLAGFLTALLPAGAAAQGYRVRLDARGQAVSYRGLQADSVSSSAVVTGANGGLESADGYAVQCITGAAWCYYYRPGELQRSVPLSTTADLVLWGFGVRGLSLRASGRFITDAADNESWPGTEPNAQLLEGYLEYEAGWLALRGGRQLLYSRLQPMGFDGGWARARLAGAALEVTGYGGWGLGQAAVVPITSPALNPLDEWRPTDRQMVVGTEVAWRPGPFDLRAEYRREKDDNADALVSERASLSFNAQPRAGFRLTGGADYNIDYDQLGSADLTMTWLGKKYSISAGGRRYQPYFSLWTLWGAFSPVPYNAVTASGQYQATGKLSVRARGEMYWYEAAEVSTPGIDSKTDGWRASLGATYVASRQWTFDGSWLVDRGFGAPSTSWDVSATYQPTERLQLAGYGGRLFRPLEFRYYDATGTWVGARAAWSFADQMSVWGDGQYIKDDRDRPDAAATNWDQLRLRAGVTVTFGSNADRRAPLPPARRSLP
jgi:hypothetical protein